MRDCTLDYQSLDASLSKLFSSTLQSRLKDQIWGRSSVSNITKCDVTDLESINIYMRDYDSLLFYSILYHYIDDKIIYYNVRFALEEIFNLNPDIVWMNALLDSKSAVLEYLLGTTSYHSREIFGNILDRTKMEKRIRSIRPQYKIKKRPKRVQRHRGYRDKGTLPPYDAKIRRRELSLDVWNTELQNKIEVERQTRLDMTEFLKGFLSG